MVRKSGLGEIQATNRADGLQVEERSHQRISFLLGFEEPNWFFRAFHRWTGSTPEQARLR